MRSSPDRARPPERASERPAPARAVATVRVAETGAAELEEPLRIDRATWEALVARAESDFPFEVCGLLGIEGDGAIRHFPIDNAERSMTYYVMDAKQMLRAMREIEDDELHLVIYHSHTHTKAYPSATDVRLAAYPDATYAIVTLQDRDAPAIRAFRIVDGQVTERAVELVARARP